MAGEANACSHVSRSHDAFSWELPFRVITGGCRKPKCHFGSREREGRLLSSVLTEHVPVPIFDGDSRNCPYLCPLAALRRALT